MSKREWNTYKVWLSPATHMEISLPRDITEDEWSQFDEQILFIHDLTAPLDDVKPEPPESPTNQMIMDLVHGRKMDESMEDFLLRLGAAVNELALFETGQVAQAPGDRFRSAPEPEAPPMMWQNRVGEPMAQQMASDPEGTEIPADGLTSDQLLWLQDRTQEIRSSKPVFDWWFNKETGEIAHRSSVEGETAILRLLQNVANTEHATEADLGPAVAIPLMNLHAYWGPAPSATYVKQDTLMVPVDDPQPGQVWTHRFLATTDVTIMGRTSDNGIAWKSSNGDGQMPLYIFLSAYKLKGSS